MGAILLYHPPNMSGVHIVAIFCVHSKVCARARLEDISKRIGKDVDAIETTLDKMAKRGIVFKERKGDETVYRLLPIVVGWAETSFWPRPGKDNRQKKLAPLWDKYWSDVALDEIGDRGNPIKRTLSEKNAISEAQVMPYEDAVELAKARDYHVVGHCPCRIIARLSGKECKHSLENCLHFGSMGRYMVEQGFGRKLKIDETLEILKKANREGLVHVVENHSSRLNVLCNCCDDCCIWFRAIYEAKHPNALCARAFICVLLPNLDSWTTFLLFQRFL